MMSMLVAVSALGPYRNIDKSMDELAFSDVNTM